LSLFWLLVKDYSHSELKRDWESHHMNQASEQFEPVEF
jgi:hypothetical protein